MKTGKVIIAAALGFILLALAGGLIRDTKTAKRAAEAELEIYRDVKSQR